MSRTHHSDSLWALLLFPGHITVAHWGHFVVSRTHHSDSLGALCCVQDTSQWLTGDTLLCPGHITVTHWGHFVVSRTHHSGSLGTLCCVQDTSQWLTVGTCCVQETSQWLTGCTLFGQDTSADNRTRCNQFGPTLGLTEPSVLVCNKTV